MTVCTTKIESGVLVRVIAKGGGILGDFVKRVQPDGRLFSRPYAWWAALEDGQHEIDD